MIMIQNMKNIESKFQIDLKCFSQHLVNTGWSSGKSNSRILENSSKVYFFQDKNFQSLVNQNLKVFSMGNVFWKILKGVES